MAEYDVVLRNGNMIAVVPKGTPVNPSSTRVYVYDTATRLWRTKRHIQSMLSRQHLWQEPDEPTTVDIANLIPTKIMRMH